MVALVFWQQEVFCVFGFSSSSSNEGDCGDSDGDQGEYDNDDD